jgi:hypothetical protein
MSDIALFAGAAVVFTSKKDRLSSFVLVRFAPYGRLGHSELDQTFWEVNQTPTKHFQVLESGTRLFSERLVLRN